MEQLISNLSIWTYDSFAVLLLRLLVDTLGIREQRSLAALLLFCFPFTIRRRKISTHKCISYSVRFVTLNDSCELHGPTGSLERHLRVVCGASNGTTLEGQEIEMPPVYSTYDELCTLLVLRRKARFRYS